MSKMKKNYHTLIYKQTDQTFKLAFVLNEGEEKKHTEKIVVQSVDTKIQQQ